MATINDVYKGLTKIGNNIAKKGGTMVSANRSYSLEELADGVMTIPDTIVGSGDSVIVYEMPATTISVYDLTDTLIDSDTTDATNGGMVQINVSAAGTYRVIATKGGNAIWNSQVAINGPTLVKTPLSVNDYTEDEIEASCVNHYAHNMFEIGDYRNETLMGSSNQKKYILGFNCKELEGGGTAEIYWGFLGGTPSSYNVDSVSSNTCSWVGSGMRQRCLPSGSAYYRYDSTVNSSTSGTYYVYNFENDTWVAKTLPLDFDASENYYTLNTTASDGVFYTSALSSSVFAHAKNVINYTWVGSVKGQTLTDVAVTSNELIKTVDKLFLPSGKELFGFNGGYMAGTMSSGNWAFNQNEGIYSGISFDFIYFVLNNVWLRSPNPYAPYWVTWTASGGRTGYQQPTQGSSLRAFLCYCQ